MRRLVLIFFVASVVVLAIGPEAVAGQDSFEQVVDNATEGRFEADESWGTSSYGRGVNEENYRFARPTDTSEPARFKVEIPETANYAVYARWPQVKGGNGSAPVGVVTTSGTEWTRVNQQRDGGRWVKLGVYEMQAGDDYSVMFSREADGEDYVIADAVKVEYDSQATPSEPTESDEAESSDESDAEADRTGQDVIGEAKRWLGVRYRHGGITRRGIDCSGLTMQVYKKFGASLPHWDDKQYRMGKKVSGRPEPGDLVFFDEHGRGISHVGIYSGNGKLIHASDYYNEVIESDMRHIKGYVGARRMLVDGRPVGRSSAADEQPTESRDDSADAPETEESSPPAEAPRSSTNRATKRVSPPATSGTPQKAENKRRVQVEENADSQTWVQRVIRRLKPDVVQKQAPAPSKEEPSNTGKQKDQERRPEDKGNR